VNISAQIPNNIKRVSKSLGYTLWLDTFEDWDGLSLILRSLLTDRQRAALAFMALKALDYDQAVMAAEAALSEGAGQPIAPLFNHMDESAFWTDMATPDELDAYALASFNAMPAPRKAAFLEFVQGRQVA
jgi:hypothetical protein